MLDISTVNFLLQEVIIFVYLINKCIAINYKAESTYYMALQIQIKIQLSRVVVDTF